MSDANRKSVRLPQFLYRGASYFVTICAFQQRCTFGQVEGEATILSALGRIVDEEWKRTPLVRPGVQLDEWIVMPNHVHGIVYIPDVKRDFVAPRGFVRPRKSLASLIAGYKSGVTHRAKVELSWTPPVWQRNYFEHIIRGEADLERARRYIFENPVKWGARCAPLPIVSAGG
ncbi:MAG TPA: transposase [Thermoanaerobaculia bacterium]|nr:transposase [Thermoanaerobaculia bacterium]